MNIIEALILDSIFILFPLFCYFIFATSDKSINKRTGDILFELALYTSLYLILSYDVPHTGVRIMFLTVPLLIAYLKKKYVTIIVFSVTIALNYICQMNIDATYVSMEFLIYLIFMFYLIKRKETNLTIISSFVIIKSTFIIFELDILSLNYIDIISEIVPLIVFFYITTLVVCYLMVASEKTMNMHMTMKELEHQKQLRDSLFKITHEIKNPIAVCKGYLDMFDINDLNHSKKYVPIIKQEIERTLSLMNDYMMFTKIDVQKRRMDASVLLQDVCEMSSLLLKGKKIKFICSIQDEEIYIDGDYDRLKQVFVNVVKNAVESIPNSKNGKISFNSKLTLKNLIITVSDNGCGMSSSILAKIGEPFYTTKQNGTGLGVKFCKEIMESHNGIISYKSKANEGTTVTISIPLKKSLS